MFADKPLSVYDKTQITKDFPRPNVESVFTPVFDDYLSSLVTGAKGVDKETKKFQDQLSDIVGPVSMAFEHNSNWHESEDNPGSIILSTQEASARGSVFWKMVPSPTKLPNQREKLIFQRPGPEQGKVPSCSTRSELCSTPKFPVTAASQAYAVTLNISLPLDKVKSIRRECQKVFENADITIRELALLLGKLSASIQAVFPAPLHYRHIQAVKKHTLALLGGYESPVCWTEEGLEELKWWRDHLSAWNWRAVLRTPPHLTIETNASPMGWGACCGNFQTRGLWSQSERLLHINCLELLAGGFALKSFLKNKYNIHVKLMMDNTTAISYINKMGGPTSLILSSLAFDLWQWCLNRSIRVEAHRLPGRLKFVADFESRAHPDSSDWKLEPSIFQGINNKWDPFTIDLFESRLTTKLSRFMSRKPDPEAEAMDAFTLDWSQLKDYAFPPFALIGRCLKQVLCQSVSQLTNVTPVWETQPWYPLLLEMTIDNPLFLPSFPRLLSRENELHPLAHLQLAAWLVSGVDMKVQQFHCQLKDCSGLHEEPGQKKLILQLGESGTVGVVNNKSIPFQHL
ncbi:hypothetical protein AWC38_SpisGene3019 [Stylophora pistillata]|uniref:Uncharacterized protein n=1 Tax=Stylophora pistillata TaxID=50429 RepID=A0A2B4SUG5_STYPI|nr:hypothetical protein AWC38_SpisGene3019 [Stylophora pistillata]